MKVLVTTIVALNPGDAAILLGTERIVRRALGKETEIAAVDGAAGPAAALYPWMRFLPSLWSRPNRSRLRRFVTSRGYGHRLQRFDAWRLKLAGRWMHAGFTQAAALLARPDERAILREYLEADLVLASGGTYLVPAYGMESAVLDYELTLALGRPLAFMPQSMGPFVGSRLEPRLRAVFAGSRFILVRDEQSRRHLADIDIAGEKVIVVPDAAFALASEAISDNAGTLPQRRLRRVAVSVREWKHTPGDENAEARYLAGVAEFVSWLVQVHGASVTFLSSCQGIPDYWTDDAHTARRIVATLDADVAARVTVDGKFRGPQELIRALAEFDLVVATRMHVAILALCSGRPVLPIAYEFKTTELFATLGLGHLVTPFESASGTALVEKAQMLLASWDECLRAFDTGAQRLGQSVAGIQPLLQTHASTAESA